MAYLPTLRPTPITTLSVRQSFLVEPLHGPKKVPYYLSRFPIEIYNKSPDTHLVQFFSALLGETGVNYIRKNSLQARLMLEELGLELFDFERFFGDPLQFGRLVGESFENDPEGLIPKEDYERILAKNTAYRSRAIDYISGARAGNTPYGMQLTAKAGLGHDVEIVENYKYLFDQHSDDPIGFDYYGKTLFTEEMIVLPRQEISRAEVQIIFVTGDPDLPDGGQILLTFNGEQTTIPYNATSLDVQEALESLPSIGVGNVIVYGGASPKTASDGAMGVGDINLYCTTSTPFNSPQDLNKRILVQGAGADGADLITTITAVNSNSNVVLADAAQTAVTGAFVSFDADSGSPWQVQFINALANEDVPQIEATSALLSSSDSYVTAGVRTLLGGLDSTNQVMSFTEADKHHLYSALDRTKPMTTIVTTGEGQGKHYRKDWQSVTASSEYTEVLRYVTGNPNVAWPATNGSDPWWIEASTEHCAPRIKNDKQQHYQNFHTVGKVRAFTDTALTQIDLYEADSTYTDGFPSYHIGEFNQTQRNLFPLLDQWNPRDLEDSRLFAPEKALANGLYNSEIRVMNQFKDDRIFSYIDGFYPTQYLNLPGVPGTFEARSFWASKERTSGYEYLELDFGQVRAVNYVSFEITNKPVDFSIAFDTLDLAPKRRFITAKFDPNVTLSVTTTDDDNPWHRVEIYFTNAVDQMIYTKYLLLRFERKSPNPFFNQTTQLQYPWSIEVKNLRVGRNVS